MTKAELNAFQTALAQKQAELENGTRNRLALAIETNADELDRIQHACERDYAMRDLERNSGRLREVRAAMRRINAGTFRICPGCEEDIKLKRLAAVPWALPCIVCQQKADREEDWVAVGELDASPVMAA